MIFLTVGTQLPFDRLVRAVDEMAPLLGHRVFAQIGEGAKYVPRNLEYQATLDPSSFRQMAEGATLLLSHAGIGSILTARKYRKQIVLFPRLARLGEHRNDHQLDTCKQMQSLDGVHVAHDESSLVALMSDSRLYTPPNDSFESPGKRNLESALSSFIHTGKIPS